MSRYIDADKFYASQVARCWGEPIIGTCTSDNALLADELQKLPISDVVEVVPDSMDKNGPVSCSLGGDEDEIAVSFTFSSFNSPFTSRSTNSLFI